MVSGHFHVTAKAPEKGSPGTPFRTPNHQKSTPDRPKTAPGPISETAVAAAISAEIPKSARGPKSQKCQCFGSQNEAKKQKWVSTFGTPTCSFVPEACRRASQSHSGALLESPGPIFNEFSMFFHCTTYPQNHEKRAPAAATVLPSIFRFFNRTSIFDAIFDLSYLHFCDQKSILGRLGASWKRLGRLGSVLAASWAVLGASWRVLGASCGVLLRLGGVLGASWSVLERKTTSR